MPQQTLAYPNDDDNPDFNLADETSIDANGKAYFSIRGVAHITGINENILRDAFSPENISRSKLAEALMHYGFDAANISAFGQTRVPDIAVSIITYHYAFDAGDECTEMARNSFRSFVMIGTRAYDQSNAKDEGIRNEIVKYLPKK